MKRIIVASIIALILIISLVIPIIGTSSYTGIITVANTSVTSYTNQPINMSMDITALASNYWISSTGLDTRVRSSNTELPHMLANDKLLFVSDINASQSKQLKFSTGNTPLESFPIIVGDGGYITISDNANLELGNRFNVEWAGMITSGTTGLLVGKGLAFVCTVSNGNANAAIIDTLRTETVTRSGQDLYSGSATGYGVRFMGNLAGRALVQSSWYLKKSGSPTGEIYFNARQGISPYDLIGTIGTIDASSLTDSYQWIDVFGHVVNPVAENVLYTVEYAGGDSTNKVTVGTTGEGAIGCKLTTSWELGNPIPMYKIGESSVYVSTPIPAGNRAIHVSANTSTLSISYDDNPAVSVAMGGASVPNNTNDWILNPSPYYIDYYKHTVNGTLVGWYQPNDIISGTTLPDRAGTEDGVITWGTNPENVTATISSLSLGDTSILPIYSNPGYHDTLHESSDVDIAGSIDKDQTDNILTAILSPIADLSDYPLWILYLLVAFVVQFIVMMKVIDITKNQLLGCATGLVICFGAFKLGIYDWWMFAVTIALFVAVVFFERKMSF